MIRREFLRKLAAGGGAAATLPLVMRAGPDEKRADDESARLRHQVEDLRKQLAEMKRSHKLLIKAGLVALSVAIGIDIATWI